METRWICLNGQAYLLQRYKKNDLVPNLQKMSILKMLSKTKTAISRLGKSGQFYTAAWHILENTGSLNVIIDAKCEAS